MRRWWSSLTVLVLVLDGCVTGPGGVYVVPPESAVRVPLREKATSVVEKVLRRDGWVGTVVGSETTGIIASEVSEGWFEDRVVIDVAARTPDGRPLLIPVADYPPVLTAIRKQLTAVVESAGGEAVDWWTREAHGERTLEFWYKQGVMRGTLLVRMAPRLDDRPEELITRLEFVLRERSSGE